MKHENIALLIAMAAFAANAETVSSPNGKFVIDVNCVDGVPTYAADYWGVRFIEPSPLGLLADIGDFTQGLELISVSEPVAIEDDYSLPNIKNSNVQYRANQRVYSFAKDGRHVMDITFNVDDTDAAFRYTLYPQGDTRVAMIESEATGFVLPQGTTTFLCPQAGPMTGWMRTMPSYETEYEPDAPMGSNGQGFGFTFPCLFRNNDQGWILISETGVDGSYCASHLDCYSDNGYKIGFPDKGEMNGMGHAGAAISLPGDTPWRTLTFGHSLRPIATTTIPWDVVKPKYDASQEYLYGKGTWSWIMKMEPSCNFDEQKRYIDFAADMGYSTVLVDALWDTQIGYDKIEELAAYGKSKGVDLFLWYNSNGEWNDAPQGPHNKMHRSRERRQEMEWMKSLGIRGIKVDFFGSDKQPMMQLYDDILYDANDFGLEVIFHGCTLPRGWERMYPNYVSSEAVLASENLHFRQDMCDAEAFNATIHPLVRNTVGSMDFGGSALNKRWNDSNAPDRGNVRRTSDVFALATAVLFQSPVQHFALAPNNLFDAPKWATDFMRDVPTVWDETRFIEGYPGKYLVMARRNGNTWYVAGINAQEEPAGGLIKIPQLPAGAQGILYADEPTLLGKVTPVAIDAEQQIYATMPKNGAFLLVVNLDEDN